MLCSAERAGMRGGRREAPEGGGVCVYSWFMILDSRDYPNIVKQLYLIKNKKILLTS